MYYADEPKTAKTRLPMSKELRTLGLISGIALPFVLFGCVAALIVTPLLLIMPLLLVADLTLLAVCLINPATPRRKIACKLVVAVGGSVAAVILVYAMLVLIGALPLISFTNVDPWYVGDLFK